MTGLQRRLETAEDWQRYASEARQINAKNGWGLTFAFDEIPGYVALIHSEITEAWTAESFDERIKELADVVVRCVDLAELLEPGTIGAGLAAVLPVQHAMPDALAGQLMTLHARASEVLETFRKVTDHQDCLLRMRSGLAVLVVQTIQVIERTRLAQMRHFSALEWEDPAMPKPRQTVETALWVTLDKNRARAYRHGGLRT